MEDGRESKYSLVFSASQAQRSCLGRESTKSAGSSMSSSDMATALAAITPRLCCHVFNSINYIFPT